ncbi:hypothetical protein ACHAXS_009751 [Conticribra weissflogii]
MLGIPALFLQWRGSFPKCSYTCHIDNDLTERTIELTALHPIVGSLNRLTELDGRIFLIVLLQTLQRQLGKRLTIRIVLQFDLSHRSRNIIHSIILLSICAFASASSLSTGNAVGTNGLAGPRLPLIGTVFRPRLLPPALGTPSNGVLRLTVSFSGMSSGVFEKEGERLEGIVGAGSPELVVSPGWISPSARAFISRGVGYCEFDMIGIQFEGFFPWDQGNG